MHRARCKVAAQRLIVRASAARRSQALLARDASLVLAVAMDYLFMLLAVTSHRMAAVDACALTQRGGDCGLEAAEAFAGGGVAEEGAGNGGEEAEGNDTVQVCLDVACVRRGCGKKEAQTWLRLLRSLGGALGPLGLWHTEPDFWSAGPFALTPECGAVLAQCARTCLADANLLRLPRLRRELWRHLLHSARLPNLRQLFADMVPCRLQLHAPPMPIVAALMRARLVSFRFRLLSGRPCLSAGLACSRPPEMHALACVLTRAHT